MFTLTVRTLESNVESRLRPTLCPRCPRLAAILPPGHRSEVGWVVAGG
jgi:hypothetical protein